MSESSLRKDVNEIRLGFAQLVKEFGRLEQLEKSLAYHEVVLAKKVGQVNSLEENLEHYVKHEHMDEVRNELKKLEKHEALLFENTKQMSVIVQDIQKLRDSQSAAKARHKEGSDARMAEFGGRLRKLENAIVKMESARQMRRKEILAELASIRKGYGTKIEALEMENALQAKRLVSLEKGMAKAVIKPGKLAASIPAPNRINISSELSSIRKSYSTKIESLEMENALQAKRLAALEKVAAKSPANPVVEHDVRQEITSLANKSAKKPGLLKSIFRKTQKPVPVVARTALHAEAHHSQHSKLNRTVSGKLSGKVNMPPAIKRELDEAIAEVKVAKKVVKKAARKAAKKAVKKVAKKEAKKAGKKDVKKAVPKPVAKAAKEEVKNAVVKVAQKVAQKMAKNAVKKSVQKSVKQSVKPVPKRR